ncbi:MAG: hypothetical protein WKG00_11210 [Polyangiaceae bacterium]
MLLAALAGCRADPPAGAPLPAATEAGAAPRSATICAAEASAALAARDMRRLATIVGAGHAVAFTPFGYARVADGAVRAEQLDAELRDGHVRDWGTLGESDDPLRLSFTDYLARYAWDAAYAQLGPRAAGSASYDAASGEAREILAAIGALHPGATITEYQKPPSAPGATDWRVLRLVCVPVLGLGLGGGGYRLARVIHSEWTP